MEFELIIKNYWDYYLELEREVAEVRKYVEFDKSNYNCFSIEFLKLYQAICSEIDTLGKYLAKILDNSFDQDSRHNNINKWWYIVSNKLEITEDIKDGWIKDKKVNIKNFKIMNYVLMIEDNPWKDFELEQYFNSKGSSCLRHKEKSHTPKWWHEYNKVKHLRTSLNQENEQINYAYANLGNVLNSLMALYILEIGLIQLSGSKNDLQSFMNDSLFFEKKSWASDEYISTLINY